MCEDDTLVWFSITFSIFVLHSGLLIVVERLTPSVVALLIVLKVLQQIGAKQTLEY